MKFPRELSAKERPLLNSALLSRGTRRQRSPRNRVANLSLSLSLSRSLDLFLLSPRGPIRPTKREEERPAGADRAREGRVDAFGDGRATSAASTVTKIELRPGSAGRERSRWATYGTPCAGLAAAARLWSPRCRSDFRGDEELARRERGYADAGKREGARWTGVGVKRARKREVSER